MGKTFEKTYLNGETALKPNQRTFLTYRNELLVPCALEQSKDGFTLTFDAAELAPFDIVHNMETGDNYRALAGVAALEKLQQEYTFSLRPANLMVDVNLMPKVIERDLASDWSFVEEYKALIGTTVLPEYEFEDFLHGGQDLFGKNPFLEKIRYLETVDTIKAALINEYHSVKEKQKKEFARIKKAKAARNKILVPVLVLCSIAGLAFMSWFMFYQKPYNDAVMLAYAHYEKQEYKLVKEALAAISIDRMSYEVKYMLARSSVQEEALVREKRDSILEVITMRTKEEYFDFWILMGRDSFDDAIDCAERLIDDDLLITALKKYETFVKNDASMKGVDKSTKLSELAARIEELQKERIEKSTPPESTEAQEQPVETETNADGSADDPNNTETDSDGDTKTETGSGQAAQ